MMAIEPEVVTDTAGNGRRKRKYTPVEIDRRTRAARRLRAFENSLRKQLQAQGRAVTLHDDVLVGNLANCMLRLEILRGEQSRGQFIDDEQLTRLANASQRLVSALGLRPTVLEPPATPPLRPTLASTLKAMGKAPL